MHNRFDVKVCDAKTGEIKQTAVAYNVVLDEYFKARFDMNYYIAYWADFGRIDIGSGTGTPAITDTSLFTYVGQKGLISSETTYAYPTSNKTMICKLEANEFNGTNITEVGLELVSSRGANTYTQLVTHAMLQDSEGQQISITKTDEDVVYITAVFYATITLSGFGNNGIYPQAQHNALASFLLGNGLPSDWRGWLISTTRTDMTSSSEFESAEQTAKSYSLTMTNPNLSALTFDLGDKTILDTEWNNHKVGTFGIPGVGAFVLPDASVFPDYAVTRTSLGEGDGVTQDFNIKCPLIKPGSLRVFVNNIELSASEYIFDADNNCHDDRESYYTAGMKCTDSNVQFGNFALNQSTGTERCDPMLWQYKATDGNKYPSYVTVDSAHPIWIDFEESKTCNRLRIDRTDAYGYVNEIVIEHSDDNSTWTRISDAVLTTTDGTVGSVKLYEWAFTGVSARYWRVYNPQRSWTYSFLNINSYAPGQVTFAFGKRDGVERVYASFFLGKVVPGLHLNTAPADGEAVEATYALTTPYKTANNILRMTCTVQLSRG